MKKIVMLISIASLTACGGGSGSGKPSGDPVVQSSSQSSAANSSRAISSTASSTPSSTHNLVGVWAGSEDFGADGIDESFLVVNGDNTVSVYDYAGDTYDNAGKCYWIAENIGTIKPLNNDSYAIQPAAKKAVRVKITLDGKSMTIANLTPKEDDRPSIYTLSDRTVADFMPECSTLTDQPQLASPSGFIKHH